MVKQEMNGGDHIYVRTKWPKVTHHGIYCGNGYVIHFDGHSKLICKDSLEHFCSPFPIREISVFEKCNPSLANEVMRRAESLLGKGDYDLLASNCEHFASYCITGSWKSKQADKLGEASEQTSRAGFRELARPTTFQIAQRAISGQTNPVNIAVIYGAALIVAGTARLIGNAIKDNTEKAAPPGEAPKEQQERIRPSEKSVTRLPQEPPKVDPKHKREHTNK